MRGFGEAASGRWETAIPLVERFLKYNPNSGLGKLYLAMVYGQAGREQEARAVLDKVTKEMPAAMKNVRVIMSLFPFKDQILFPMAEGLIKAGLPGEPSGFYKMSAENRLSGEGLGKLFFGRKVSGLDMITGQQWWIERGENGKAIIRDGDKSDTGKSWVEDNMLCDQWDNLYEGLRDCWVIYRNQQGTPENHDEFLGAPGYGIYPFSPAG